MPGLEAAYAGHAASRRDTAALQWRVFDTYAAAAAAIPANRISGWDNAVAAMIWTDHIDPVRPSTYPLFFDTGMHAAGEYDILLSAGALQFMPQGIQGLLEQGSCRPRIVLLNKVPLSRPADFWTLHNFGPAITPYRVFNEAAFVDYFEGHGYRVRDRWGVTDMSCDIPFHPDHTVPGFTGFCFERAGPDG